MQAPRQLPPMWTPGIVQGVPPDGVLDLADGYLDPELLPTGMMASAYAEALDEYGPAALTYGANAGVAPLRGALAERAKVAGGYPCEPENVLITAGTSQALHLLATRLGAPGDVVLCEWASYHLAKRIFSDCGLRTVPIPEDAEGPDPAALSDLLLDLRADGDRAAFAYLIPTFHNPTGRVIGGRRRAELLEVAQDHGLPIVEDDAYAELCLDPIDLPAPLAAMAGYDGVVRLCSFAKTLGPGLRLGWMLADPALVTRLAGGGLLSSGGGVNHLTSLAVTPLIQHGAYDRRLLWLRDQLKARRDALVSGLRAGGADAFAVPHGGFFLWLHGLNAQAIEPTGVRAMDGALFGPLAEPGLRLSFSFSSPTDLEEAGHRLASAYRA
ncbi:PLP-dependent aminotransferase family protein [Sphaerisporangium sp. NPDC051011]|uniref:aminotransferase-like domain-containing protein n=1 Tax=Sphaerisporangium sp. NPDC051011 TaxID=3155792 RepID=UPI0033E85FB4